MSKKLFLNIEYRKSHQIEPMKFKITKHSSISGFELGSVPLQSISDSRIEYLKKVEKFITPQKRYDFWRGIN